MPQLGARVTPETHSHVLALSESMGATQGGVVDAAVELLFEALSSVERGAMNESEQSMAFLSLQGFEIAPGPGRAMSFIRRYGARLIDTLWLASKALDDAGGPQPRRGARADLDLRSR